MRIRYVMPVLVILLFAFALPAPAEYYKYKDEKGIVHYTNDLTKIPPEQRKKLDRYKEYHKPYTPLSEEIEAETEELINQSVEGRDAEKQNIESLKNSLAARREALTNEREKLDAESARLKQNRPGKDVSKKDFEAYELSIKALNEKIGAFSKKSSRLEDDVKKYNKKVQAFNAAPPAEKAAADL